MPVPPDHEDAPPPRADLVRRAEWAGLAYLAFVFATGILRLWVQRGSFSGDQRSLGTLLQTAVAAAITAAFCLRAARPRWPIGAFSGMVTVWLAAGALSAWVIHGQPDLTYLMLAITAFGLVIGTAAVSPGRSGWAVLVAGVTLVAANWIALWVNYSTEGSSFPRSGRWLKDPSYGLGPLDWFTAAVRHDLPWYVPTGLTSNSSFTGKLLVFFVVFTVPFLLSRWRTGPRRGGAGTLAWVLLIVLAAVPGLLLLIVLEAQGAAAAVVLGWAAALIPRLPRASVRGAWVAAVLAPLAILVPVLLALAGLVRLGGRDCVWRDWLGTISGTLPWGLGPPMSFPGTRCGVPTWSHAHNELLNALSMGGVLGFLAAATTVGFLTWFAVRFHSVDQRCLLSLMVCATVIMSMNVLSMAGVDWILPGMAAFVVIAARSLQLMVIEGGLDETASASAPAHRTHDEDQDAGPRHRRAR